MEAWGSEDEDDDEAAVDVDAASDDDEEAPIQGIAVAPVARIRRGKPVPAKTDFAQGTWPAKRSLPSIWTERRLQNSKHER